MAEGFRQWRCRNCGFIYDEAAGWPDEGIGLRHFHGRD